MEAKSSCNGSDHLLTPFKLGSFNLSHRIVLAPMTRNRAYNSTPQPHAIEYYSQRSTPGGLLIAESAAASDVSQGCPNMPGIWTEEQLEAWKPIVDAVHGKGATFFCQIWHPGRMTNYSLSTWFFMDREPKEKKTATPCELRPDQIPQIIRDFKIAARNAVKAGFDGVEIHGANGYLIDQSMNDQQHGNSLESRCGLALAVAKAVANEIGAERVGMRLCPFDGDQTAEEAEALGVYMANELSKLGIVYLHASEPRKVKIGNKYETSPRGLVSMRKVFNGTFIATGGYNKSDGDKAVAEDYADLISYGRLFVANPDLPKRFELDAPLNKHDRSTFYTPDTVKGYTDYPFSQVTCVN